jgi:hypothetical protein
MPTIISGDTGIDKIAAGAIEYADLPTGSVLQVVQTHYVSTFSTTSTSLTDITGFSVSITPKFSTSKILILLSATVAQASNGGYSNGFVIIRNGSTSVGSGTAGTSSNYITCANSYSGESPFCVSANYLDSPSSTSAQTYQVQTKCQSGTGTFYVNRTGNLNAGSNPAQGGYASTITVMEIAG